ncbi:ribonuclease III [Candidatus Dojkabacteria bacterium]|uniref:Ribonuclease 3 n=1 Tax=Candidatus Dojkabacteria bacterium TaxID=2099670 RepID=A0A5C7J7K1_9BACT|nr:MAG: ribonuclease III [Candidatus Dojkabacteria bacterium]
MTKLPAIKNKKLLEEALTHRSFLNESKEKIPSNERLEFLGDSILSFIVSTYLFKEYPDFNEGKLTNLRSLLVNTKMLALLAKDCDLGSKLRLSKGEEESGGRNNPSLLADSFEAFIGALFLDQGIEAVKKFIDSTVIPQAKEFLENNSLKDPKSKLQEYVQSKKQSSPLYKVLLEEGPAHARKFTIGVYVNDELIGQGEGKSKQTAEEAAAESALKKIGPTS